MTYNYIIIFTYLYVYNKLNIAVNQNNIIPKKSGLPLSMSTHG